MVKNLENVKLKFSKSFSKVLRALEVTIRMLCGCRTRGNCVLQPTSCSSPLSHCPQPHPCMLFGYLSAPGLPGWHSPLALTLTLSELPGAREGAIATPFDFARDPKLILYLSLSEANLLNRTSRTDTPAGGHRLAGRALPCTSHSCIFFFRAL